MATKKTTNKGASVASAAALAGAAAAGATYYFYGTKNAKKHRQAASAWAKGLKRDVLKGAKSLKKIDAKTVARVVDDAASMYESARGVTKADVKKAASELKKNWKMVEKELTPSKVVKRALDEGMKHATKAVKTAKKAVRKATKKR
ncbi:MAG: hypothetical protein AAB472_01790 [Patescibacteria group bacterium]